MKPSESPSELQIIHRNEERPLSKETRLTAVLAAIAAAIACASTPDKPIYAMTEDEYRAAHPECVRVKTTEGGVEVRDFSPCSEAYADAVAAANRPPVFQSGRPENADEGARHMQPGGGDAQASPWWKANMARQPHEDVKDWAERAEKIAKSFLDGKLGEVQGRAGDCGNDTACLSYVVRNGNTEADLAQTYLQQAVEAWRIAAREHRGKETEYTRRADKLEKEGSEEIVRIRRVLGGLLQIKAT